MSAATKPIEQPAIDRDTINRLYAMWNLPVIGGGSQENDTPDDANEQDEEGDLPADLGDKGKAAIAKERQKAKDAAARAKAAEERAEALEAKQREADAAKAKADEAEAIKRGEFEALANSRAETITALTGERDGLKGQLDTLITAMRPDVEKAWSAAPESVTKLYKGDADDVIGKREFLSDHADLITALADKQEQQNEAYRRVPKTPQPNGNHEQDIKPLIPAKI